MLISGSYSLPGGLKRRVVQPPPVAQNVPRTLALTPANPTPVFARSSTKAGTSAIPAHPAALALTAHVDRPATGLTSATPVADHIAGTCMSLSMFESAPLSNVLS